jgi:LysM repeat protein
MNGYGLRGVSFPTFSVTHEGKKLQGVSLIFTDPTRAPLVGINFYLLEGIRQASGRDLFREAVKSKKDFQMLDKVTGSDATRKALLAGRPAADIVNSWRPGEEAFQRRRQKYLLYTDEPSAPSRALAQAKPTPVPVAVSVPVPSPEMMTITVSKGDTAEKIAKDLGIAASDITLANRGVDLNRLKVGQKLKIPRPSAR